MGKLSISQLPNSAYPNIYYKLNKLTLPLSIIYEIKSLMNNYETPIFFPTTLKRKKKIFLVVNLKMIEIVE